MPLCLNSESISLAFFVAFNNVLDFFSIRDIVGEKGRLFIFVVEKCFNTLGWYFLYAAEFHRKLCYWWYIFHILIDTAIFISLNFYDSDSQTPMGREKKNEIEALKWLFMDFFRRPGKFFHWLSLLLSIGKN